MAALFRNKTIFNSSLHSCVSLFPRNAVVRCFASIQQVNGVPTITAAEAKKCLNEFDYIVDVREGDEVAAGKIDGAYHVPLGRVVRDVSKPEIQQLKDKKVLVYCRSGGRSAMAAKVLNDKGFNATNLAGGYMDWTK